MHVSGIGNDKLRALKAYARMGYMPDVSRKPRNDVGSGIAAVFKATMIGLVEEVGEAMPHLTTNKPGKKGCSQWIKI